MDSKWFHQRSGSSSNYNQKKSAENVVDLTLKLGLAYDHHDTNQSNPSQHVNPDQVAPYMADFSFGCPYTPQGRNQYAMIEGGIHVGGNRHKMTGEGNANYKNYEFTNYGATIVSAGSNQYNMANSDGSSLITAQNFNHQIALSPEMENRPGHYMNLSGGTKQYASGLPVVVPAAYYPKDDSAFNPAGLPLSSAPTMNNQYYTLIDHSPAISFFGFPWKWSRRQRAGGYINVSDKRCTNSHCNTKNTPLWRKGPLGPKTLCNACGIKHRKAEEKRKAREAASRPNGA